jgi:hypothetical protein
MSHISVVGYVIIILASGHLDGRPPEKLARLCGDLVEARKQFGKDSTKISTQSWQGCDLPGGRTAKFKTG